PTIGTELTRQEKTLIGWIAPRGIVALTVAGYFASILIEDGYEDASMLMALTFALVFITVCVHGFTLGPLAKKLGLSNQDAQGVLIVGASSFSIALSKQLKKMNVPVMIADSSKGRLQSAINQGIDTYEGEILSEHAQFEADFTPYDTILAMTIDPSYNALVTQSFAPEFGYHHTFSLASLPEVGVNQEKLSSSVKAHLLFDEDAIFTELNRKINTTHTLKTIVINADNNITKETLPEDTTPLFIKKKNDKLAFITQRTKLAFDQGDQLVVLKPKK